MKFKGIYFLMIFIVLCSLSVVSADDLNETCPIQIDDSPGNFEDENLLEISEDESNVTAADEVIAGDELISDSGDEEELSSPDLTEAKNSKSPLYAIVDFGSNTIKLEIYKVTKSGKLKSVIEDSRTSVTAIYCENNTLTQKGIDELIDILDDFEDIMDLVDVKTKYVFATASLRKISNGDEVIAYVKEQFGFDINILSGEREANLSFNSVRNSELTEDDGIVIDLGGGSCEVIDFINKTPVSMESMPIGSFSCYEEYVSAMFPNETEIANIQNRVLEELGKLQISNATQRYDLFGIGGSIRAIKKVLIYLDYIGSDTTCIPISMLDTLLDEFRENTRENFEKILNVNSDRVNTFVPGVIITKTIMEYFNITNLHICKNCVREGIMMEILENESRENSPDNGTFDALQAKISNAESGSTIYLHNNYTYDDTFTSEGIVIDRPITIEGNGFTIDGAGKSRIFNISTISRVFLNNIRFVNGHAEDGGAILISNCLSDSCITDCLFENNTADYKGGAICCEDYFNGNNIANSNFTNNIADEGGAISIKGSIYQSKLRNLNFQNNQADYGGAIYLTGILEEVTLDNINFTNNTAKTVAGAIFMRNQMTSSIFNRIAFINNTAVKRDGGALSTSGKLIENRFMNILFENNTAGFNGGAWQFVEIADGNTFENINFTQNRAKHYGGAVYTTLIFINNIFRNLNSTNNSAELGGGVFYFYSDCAYSQFTDCNFINNTAKNGSAMYFNGFGGYNEMTNQNVINNTAGECGVFYYHKNDDETLSNNRYVDNTIGKSGVVYVEVEGNITIEDCQFIDNTAGNITDLCFDGEVYGNVINSIFKGKNSIYLGSGSNIHFENNMELEACPEGHFILNDGKVYLENNSLCNVIYNRGQIGTKTSIIVLDNQTIHATYTPVNVSAYCIDDNGNYIVSDNITFDINGEKLTLDMGYNSIVSFNYDLTEKGTFIINATLSSSLEDCSYLVGVIKNGKENVTLNVSGIEITPDEYGEIPVTLSANATGFIVFKLNDKTYSIEIRNATALFIAPKLDSGNYTVNVTYTGDDDYLATSQIINIYVKTVVLDAYDMTRGFNSGYDYQIKLMDDKGNGISNKLVKFTIGQNEYYAMTNGDGIARLNVGLDVGTYKVSVATPITNQSVTKTLKIIKRIQNTKNMKVYYNSNKKYTAKIIGDDGKSETASKGVTVYINSKKYTYKTDRNGMISVKLGKNMKPGTYTIKIVYKGFSQTNKVVVKHAISSKKTVKVKKSAKNVTLKVKLKGNNKKKTIKFKIKGKTYKAKTNKKGIAKLTLKKTKFKKGKNTVKISYLKDSLNLLVV